jgi:hypothetical protein
MPEHTKKTIALNVKLVPVDHSDQPVFANYSNVAVAQGIAYLDFGFIEPHAFSQVVHAAQNGQPLPKSVEGKLGTRLAVGLDVIQRLHQQLGQIVAGLKNGKETGVHTP